MFRNRFKQVGQGMTEYIIIVALIAIAAIAVYSLFGTTVKNQVAGMAKELSGGDGSSSTAAAATAAGKAEGKAGQTGGLGKFTGQNKP